MPTKKPVIQVVLEEKYFKKIKKIADSEGRSMSNQASRIIEKFIDEYEKENGKINIINIEGDNHGNITM